MNSGPKVGIGDHLIAQKVDQRPQESTGEGGMEGHVAKSKRWKPEVNHIGQPREVQVPSLWGKRMFFGATRWRTIEHARVHDRTKSGRFQFE